MNLVLLNGVFGICVVTSFGQNYMAPFYKILANIKLGNWCTNTNTVKFTALRLNNKNNYQEDVTE